MSSVIMVVDDDDALRFTLTEILEDEGREVVSASDGYQALQRANRGDLSLIFMDIQMPGMNGVDTFLQIKEILPKCTVVMMTGFTVEDLVKKALKEGAYTVLHKPISIEKMLEIMEEVVPETVQS